MPDTSSYQSRFAIEQSALLHIIGHGLAAYRLDAKLSLKASQSKEAGLAITPAKDCERRIKLCNSLMEAIEKGDGLLIIRNCESETQ